MDRPGGDRAGDATYLADARAPRTVTYRELANAVDRWDRRLTAAGVPAGATVVTALADPLDAARALLGLVATGRVAAPVDPAAPRALDKRRADPATTAVLTALGLDRLPDRLPAARRAGVLLWGSTGESKQILFGEAHLTHVAATVTRSHRLGPDEVGYCPLPLYQRQRRGRRPARDPTRPGHAGAGPPVLPDAGSGRRWTSTGRPGSTLPAKNSSTASCIAAVSA